MRLLVLQKGLIVIFISGFPPGCRAEACNAIYSAPRASTGYRGSVKLTAVVCFGEICLRVKGQMQMEPLSVWPGMFIQFVEEQMR